jgi:hypothetical protein
MEIHIRIIGVILIVLALAHSLFPKYFNWGKELRAVSLINKEMMYVHTFFIALMLCLMGILCLTSAHDLIHTPLGNRICLGLGIFWTARLLIQFFGYSTVLWRGKQLESFIHITFAAMWLYAGTVFLMVYFKG